MKAGFVYDLPKLVLSVPEIKIRVQEGQNQQASFHIKADDGSRVTGTVMTDSARIALPEPKFGGTDCAVDFLVSAAGLSAGEALEEEILVRSNLGETVLSVRADVVESAGGDFDPAVRTLDDFSGVCQKSLREGFRLFTNPEFPRILNGNNRQYQALYKGMSHNPVTYQHLEEFLVSTGKKRPIALSLDKQEKAVYHLDVSQKDTLYVYRNTWGYVRLEVEVEGDFLEVDKRVITTDDFIGKVYGLEYIVHREQLGQGKAFGRIVIRGVHQTLTYEVEASVREESEIHPSAVRNRRMAWLMRDYLDLQLHILSYPDWAESSSLTVGEMLEEDPWDSWAILYKAYLAYSREDAKAVIEALWPLKDGSASFDSSEQRGLYLFLAKKVQLLPEEETNILPVLRRFYKRRPSSYLLLRLIHEESGGNGESSADRMQEFEDCFAAGCTSPFLYLDAWNLLAKEESLLRRLSPFMVQVLCFGEKTGMITEGLLQRAAFLTDNQKTFQKSVYRLLTEGYEKFPNDDVLEAICKLLIKGDPVRPECFPWYAKAVDHDVRVTRLYEYYMETYHEPASAELPVPIRMYFATNNTLGERKKALLYASIILHKEDDQTSYLNYAKNMRTFAMDSLKKGRIDANYAILYREFFRDPGDEEIAGLLARVLFARKVTVEDPRMRRVIVAHTSLKEESAAFIRDGVAYPDMYTDDACILLEDASHRRYATTVPYQAEKLMDTRDMARAILDAGVDDAGCELCICHEKAWQIEVNSNTVQAYRKAVGNDAFTDSYRNLVRRKLLEYDLKNPDAVPDFANLTEEDIDAYASADRLSMEILLIREGRYEDAFRVIGRYGYEKLQRENLLRLADGLMAEGRYTDEALFVKLCRHIFDCGIYDDRILTVLERRYEGPLGKMCDLWLKVRGFQMESVHLEERILLTAIRTHTFPEDETDILESFVRQRGRQEVIDAFLAYAADYYFLGGRTTDAREFAMMEDLLRRGEEDDTVCKLALLKYYSEQEALNKDQTELCRNLLREMNEKGYRFDFYADLPKDLIAGYQIEDKVFIQEQFSPDSRVVLHYQLTEQDGTAGKWEEEPMRNVYEGIFVREFLLFYGETLTYFLTVTKGRKNETTDRYQLSLVDMDTEGHSRYKLLNRMLEARDHQDEQKFSEAMEQYLQQEAYVRQLLHVMD